MKVRHIAIDGPSSSGKSTLAAQLAKALGYRYIDSGAYYRAIAWYFLENQIAWHQPELVRQALSTLKIQFIYDQEKKSYTTLVNDCPVDEAIRSRVVTQAAGEVSTLLAVREFVTQLLQAESAGANIVMDGRDIGTLVLPDADLKIFVTASEQARTDRRIADMQRRGEAVSPQMIARDLAERDRLDMTRPLAPLKMAADAVILDNTDLDVDEQLQVALRLVKEKLNVP